METLRWISQVNVPKGIGGHTAIADAALPPWAVSVQLRKCGADFAWKPRLWRLGGCVTSCFVLGALKCTPWISGSIIIIHHRKFQLSRYKCVAATMVIANPKQVKA